MMRAAMLSLARAALASIGETEPREKWIVSLLRENRDALGADVSRRYASLIREWPTESPRQYIRDAIAFADAEFLKIAHRQRAWMPFFERLGRQAATVMRLP
jgi:hypothetical protein